MHTHLKILKKPWALLFFILLNGICIDLTAQTISQNNSALIKGSANRFTGNVWVQYFENDTLHDFLASKVIFEPNARSNWHFHQGKQIIFCAEGEGFYKEKGKPMRVLKKGDLVAIEPLTIHAHGSLPTTNFTQAVMMNGIVSKESTTWLNKVSWEEIENN